MRHSLSLSLFSNYNNCFATQEFESLDSDGGPLPQICILSFQFLGFWIGFGFVPTVGCVLKSLTIRRLSCGAPRDIFQAKELFNWGTNLLFSGDTINILGAEDQNSQWSKAYSFYSSPSTQNEVIWTSGIARAAYVPKVFSCKHVVSWSPSAHNEVIWTSGIDHVGCVPKVFDCKEVVSWCVERPVSSQRIIPLSNHSCFFVTSGFLQDVEIVAANIDLRRRRLQGVPKK
jgi:hypothetical protein